MESGISASFLTGGDVAPNRVSGTGMFGEISSIIRETDFSFVNLEHPLSQSGKPNRGKKSVHRGTPEMINGLVEAKFDAVVLSNNHMLDFGEEGMFETMKLLRTNSILFTGAGENIAAASKPVVVEKSNLKIGLIGYSTTVPQGYAASSQQAGINHLRVQTAYQTWLHDDQPGRAPIIRTWTIQEDLERMMADIRRLKNKVDTIIVYFHWGVSMILKVHDFQTELGHAAIDVGADAVFGGHQHLIAPIEFYKGKPIVHGSGNLIVDGVRPHFTEASFKTFLFGGTLVKGGIKDCYIVPCLCGVNGPPDLLPIRRNEGHEIVTSLQRLSEPFGTIFKMRRERVDVMPS